MQSREAMAGRKTARVGGSNRPRVTRGLVHAMTAPSCEDIGACVDPCQVTAAHLAPLEAIAMGARVRRERAPANGLDNLRSARVIRDDGFSRG